MRGALSGICKMSCCEGEVAVTELAGDSKCCRLWSQLSFDALSQPSEDRVEEGIRLLNSVLGAFTQEILAWKETSASVNLKHSSRLPFSFFKDSITDAVANMLYSFEYMYMHKIIAICESISGDYINDNFVFLLCYVSLKEVDAISNLEKVTNRVSEILISN